MWFTLTMNENDFKTEEAPENPIATIDEFEEFSRLYSVEDYDVNEVSESYLVKKTGVRLKSGIRALKPHEEASYVVDIKDQTCSCEAFNRMHSRGACKHIKPLNFAKKHNCLDLLKGEF